MQFVVGGIFLLAIAFTYYSTVVMPKGKAADGSEQVQTVKVTATVEFPK